MKLLNYYCSNSKFSNEENHQIKRAVKVSFLSNSSNPDKAFVDEKNRINKLINQKIKETTQLENNLGFFQTLKERCLMIFKLRFKKIMRKINDLRDELKKLSEAYHKK